MKNISLVIVISAIVLIFSPSFLKAEEPESTNSLVIITPLEAQREILPDRYVFSSNITVLSSTEADALNVLGEIDRRVRERGVKYRGGNFSVFKNCWWQKDRQVCEGYRGDVSYRFEMSSPTEQNKVLEVFSDYKKSSGAKVDINISGTNWIVSEEKAKQVMEELRFTVIRNSMDFARRISDILKRPCKVKEINFKPRPTPSFPPYRTMLKEKSIESPEPKRDKRSLFISAEIKVLCR